MNPHADAAPEPPVDSQGLAPAVTSPTRPLYWSVLRELWENRFVYISLLAVAGIYLLGFFISMIHFPAKMRAAAALDPMQQHKIIEQPYHILALLIMGIAVFVAVFYCLDALHSERRDRSILFWKSLPVSDLTTVLSKAAIPILVLPLLSLVITIATQWIMLLLSSAVLVGSGMSAAILWTRVPWIQLSVMLLFHLLAIHGLWYAPFYGWLLLASAWARRATYLWAALPLLAIGILEKLVFNTSHFGNLLKDRFMGGGEGGTFPPDPATMNPMTHLDLGGFLLTPGLWTGLALTALFLALAVRLRRYREPI